MIRVALALFAVLLSTPAAAKVHETASNGFVLRHAIEVPTTPEAAWDVFVTPAQWWSETYSFSQDAANFSLDPRAGGCFCEVLPSKISPNAAPRGSVEHLRVVYVEQPRAMRLSGALGPLQSSAVQGMLTVFFRPTGKGTRILMEYVVGGYLRKDPKALATTVDLVLSEQILRLGKALGRVNADTPGDSAPDESGREQDEHGEGAQNDFAREMAAALADPPATEPETIAPEPSSAPEPSVPGSGEQEPQRPMFEGR